MIDVEEGKIYFSTGSINSREIRAVITRRQLLAVPRCCVRMAGCKEGFMPMIYRDF